VAGGSVLAHAEAVGNAEGQVAERTHVAAARGEREQERGGAGSLSLKSAKLPL